MEIRVICGNCGEPIKMSPGEIKDGKIILTLDQEHSCFPEYSNQIGADERPFDDMKGSNKTTNHETSRHAGREASEYGELLSAREVELINEQLEVQDLEDIRLMIRRELARVFFDLYRKKKVWEN